MTGDEARAELAEVGTARFTARDYRPGIVRHIVLFRFSGDASPYLVSGLVQRFRDLTLAPRDDGGAYILSIESGKQSSPEDAGHGFEHAFIVSFASGGDRNYYVGKPILSDGDPFDSAHDAFKRAVEPALADVLVFDFEP